MFFELVLGRWFVPGGGAPEVMLAAAAESLASAAACDHKVIHTDSVKVCSYWH